MNTLDLSLFVGSMMASSSQLIVLVRGRDFNEIKALERILGSRKDSIAIELMVRKPLDYARVIAEGLSRIDPMEAYWELIIVDEPQWNFAFGEKYLSKWSGGTTPTIVKTEFLRKGTIVDACLLTVQV